ncbi:unnamed protein product [marine sediment metagenome]|uniref:Uncharacterized protein n=1 Tax=marine sediment metagenome TaxID=412755 RepID=X1J2F2_9ZZZZ
MDERPRVRVTKAIGSCVVAATPIIIHQLTTGRTAKLVKLMWYNGQAADVILEIGSYAAGPPAALTRRLPRIKAIAGQHDGLSELECPEFEFEGDIGAQASAAGAGAAAVEVQATVEEVG